MKIDIPAHSEENWPTFHKNQFNYKKNGFCLYRDALECCLKSGEKLFPKHSKTIKQGYSGIMMRGAFLSQVGELINATNINVKECINILEKKLRPTID